MKRGRVQYFQAKLRPNSAKHGFLAGNNVYYVGGRLAWDKQHETIGLTHPFHHDLR